MQPLPPTVKTLGWVSFWADVSSELVYPILPLFIVGTLKAPVWTVGLIEGLALFMVSILRFWSGFQSDRIGRRVPFIRWGYGVAVISKPLLGLAQSWGFVLGCRLLDRFGKGIRTSSRDALIADCVDKADAGRAFGYHRAMDASGAFCGVLIGIALLYFLPNELRLILLLSGIPGIFAVLTTFFIKDVPHTPAPGSGWKFLTLPKETWMVLGITGVFGLANSSDTFLLLRAQGVGMEPYQVAMLYGLFNLIYAALSMPLGVLSDKIGRANVLLMGWAGYALVYLLVPASGPGLLILSFGLYGLVTAATDGVSKAFIVSHAPPDRKGTLMGIYYIITGVAALVASVVAGLLWDRVNWQSAFWFGSALAGVASLALLVFLRRFPESKA